MVRIAQRAVSQARHIEKTLARLKLSTLAERENRYMRRVLKVCEGDVTRAARVLGIGRATLYRKLSSLALGASDWMSERTPLRGLK